MKQQWFLSLLPMGEAPVPPSTSAPKLSIARLYPSPKPVSVARLSNNSVAPTSGSARYQHTCNGEHISFLPI